MSKHISTKLNYFHFNRLIKSAVIVTLVVAAIGCSSRTKQTDRLTIGVSIPPIAAIVDELTNHSANVITIVKSDANPEIFEPSVSDFVGLNNASALFITGQFPFESDIKSQLPETVEICNATDGITLLYGTHSDCNHAHRHSAHDNASQADPHVWTSYRNGIIIARNIADGLARIDPGHADDYKARLAKLTSRLDSLDNATSEKLNTVSVNRAFMVWHPSLSYFAADYGLNQIAIGAENKESSVIDTRDRINRASQAGVKAMFIQSNYDSRQADNIAKQLDIDPVAINPMDYHWENQLTLITDAIAR